MADVAVISVLVTGSIAIAVPALNHLGEYRRARLTLAWARQDELRGVLEAASNAYHDVFLAMTAVANTLEQKAARNPAADSAFDGLQVAFEALWFEENRLAVRLGMKHPLFSGFLRGVRLLWDGRSMLLHDRARGSFDRSAYEEMKDQAADIQAEFWDRAAALVGPTGT